MERKTLAQEREEFRRYLEEVSRPKAEVVEFPSKLAEAERERQRQVAEQDRLRREAYQRLCDETWQRNLDQWRDEERQRAGGFHRGYGDSDWPA
jgi:hypothetical protein